MHEDLLGYLLGALGPVEMQRVSDWLRDNPEGQQQLSEIERSLKPFEEGFEAVEPPSEDLLARTLAGIPEGPPPTREEARSLSGSPVTLTDVDFTGEAGPGTSRWRMIDSIGGLLSVATLLALLLPSIAAGRFQARKVSCQEQLRGTYTALMQYVFRDPQERLPQVAESGPEAFAGVYKIRLADAGLLSDIDQLWCASVDRPATNDRTPQRFALLASLPSAAELSKLSVNDLQRVQRIAGGDFSYTLGVIGEHGYSSPRYEARTSFAIMSDAPLSQPVHADGTTSFRFSHGGRGMNVLYEDGSVRFVRADALDSMRDHPLVNHAGASEAGVNIDDASLSPSWRAPFSISPQR